MGNKELPAGMLANTPISALAPMQDVTTLPFMSVVNECGPPDYFFTEYFRVHGHSTLETHILESITENPSDRPVFAQLIGEGLSDIARTIKELQKHPIAGVDLNMGCPAPKVYKKNVGGGLLRDVAVVDKLLGFMRNEIPGLFTVKMRLGFEDMENFEPLLELINKHEIDLLSVHGRTVKEMYRGDVHYDYIKRAVEIAQCPVLANGNITSYKKAEWVLNYTGAHGVMIGRSAIRNPWIFRQIREHSSGQEVHHPTLADVYNYIQSLLKITYAEGLPEKSHISRMKKLLNFLGQGIDEKGKFLKEMRRATTYDILDEICKRYLLDDGKDEQLFATEPFEGVIARPNCEGKLVCSL